MNTAYEARVNSWCGEANTDKAGNLLYPSAIASVVGLNALIPKKTTVRLVELVGAAWIIELPDGYRTSIQGKQLLALNPDTEKGSEYALKLDSKYEPYVIPQELWG